MITTLSDSGEYWIITSVIFSLIFLVISVIYFITLKGWKSICALCTFMIFGLWIFALMTETIIISNEKEIWIKDQSGIFQKHPKALWWKKEYDKKMADGSIVEKQLPGGKMLIHVFQGKNKWELTCSVPTPEQEFAILENLDLSRDFKGVKKIVNNIVIHAFARHGTNIADYTNDPDLKGIVVSTIVPYTEKKLAVRDE